MVKFPPVYKNHPYLTFNMAEENFEVLEKKETGLKKHVVKQNDDKYLVSTVDLLPPEMKESFNEKIISNVQDKGRYETSIFSFKEGEPDLGNSVYSERYESEENALKGHEDVMDKLKKGKIDLEE